MSVTKWIALGAIAAVSLVSSTASAAAPKKARDSKSPVERPEPVVDVDSLPDAPVATPSKRARPVVEDRTKARAQAEEEHVEPLPPPPAPEPKPEVRESKADAAPLAVGAPKLEDEASAEGGKLSIHPYVLLSGGVKADFVVTKPREVKDDRVSTFALGRIGLRARWLDFVYVESELMASGGIGLHGTSAYEGQAALQVRQQMIRLSKAGFRAEVGRIIDEASLDYVSAHVADTFFQDRAVREPLLYSGFNLGNGVRASYEIVPGLRAALTFNAGNPVSSTASLLVGGGYPPHERFYTQPYVAVGQSANNFPDDTFHSMVVTPSVLVDTKYVDVRVAVQGFDIDPNMASNTNDDIRGYNVRGTVRAKLFDGLLVPFASTAYTKNDTLVQTNLAQRAKDRYQAVNAGGGIDVDLARRYRCSHDCADGFGVQYQQVQYQIGEGLVTTERYVNVGATYWLAPNVSVGVRYAQWTQEAEQPIAAAAVAAGKTLPDIVTSGERSGIVSLRFVMP